MVILNDYRRFGPNSANRPWRRRAGPVVNRTLCVVPISLFSYLYSYIPATIKLNIILGVFNKYEPLAAGDIIGIVPGVFVRKSRLPKGAGSRKGAFMCVDWSVCAGL